MSSTGYCPPRASAVVEPEQAGHAAAVSGHTGVDVVSGLGRTGLAVAGGAGEALGQVLAGLRADANVPAVQAGIEAGQRVLGNRAFMQWMRALGAGKQADAGAARGVTGPARPVAGVPVTDCGSLQLMGKKKKQQQAAEAEAGTCKQAAGAEGDAGTGAQGKAGPGPGTAQPPVAGAVPGLEPEPPGGAAAGAQKKKKKSRVQVALNTLRAEGVAAFGGYIEAEIGETELLRKLVERITRAEDLRNVRAQALEAVRGRLGRLDPAAGSESAGAAMPAQVAEIAVIAPVRYRFSRREQNLFRYCTAGKVDLLKQLLRTVNVDVNLADKQGTPLCYAAYLGKEGIVSELLSTPGIDVNLAQQGGATPLFMAVQQGHAAVVRLLLGASGIDVNLATLEGATPLYMAARYGLLDVAKLLLGRPEINVNLVTLTEGTAPLSIAAQKGQEAMVELLLAVRGIGIDMQKDDGATALFMAAQQNFPGIVKKLAERGADVNLAKNDGMTPLCVAALLGNIEVVKTLLQVPGIQVDLASDNGTMPVGVAAQQGHKEIVRLLLRKGADPNGANQIGVTPLHVACLYGHTATVQILLHAGADTTAGMTDSKGISYTPCRFAELAGHREVMSVLAAHRRRREAAPPRSGRPPVTDTPAEDTQPPPVSVTEAGPDPDTARVSPFTATPSPQEEATPVTEPPTPLAQARDALRQEVLGKLRADNFDTLEGIHLLEDVNDTPDLDSLCTLYNRLAHIERQKERSRRYKRRRETLQVALRAEPAAAEPAAAPVFALDKKTGLDSERVEVEIKRHLGQAYHRFVSQAVNDMEFGRGKRTTGYPELWHVSAGIPGVGSCSVFYYLDAVRNRIRVVGIGRHVGRAAYELAYAAEELGETGRVLCIS